ncbi:hypothetical protein BDF20DRAFT_974853 [Mycotypha africana]|uniref:uncharacterized protein n=1 Tax=Mycotypha africana TaxID=64632 RepID=UPI002300AF5B|nr:uncharacterized protein BDF20DRAFT_974853 [Mycotypha africana]KAI8979716.1 hypothetical protein BDF20DRAFT_974853 [Mycotypha africana]
MNSNQIYANEHKMRRRRIIVCLDGTWETPEEKTNVYKFFNRIDTTQTDEWEHSAQYYSGLGTHWRHPLMGGLFGYGISKQIVTAYQYICNAYRDEKDEIWLLGFSRGAFAARSLSGMINNVGLLPSSKVSNKAKRAFQIYRDGSTNSYPTKKIATKFRKDNQCIVPTIQFLGCFDTVGALGIPKLPWYLGGSLCKYILYYTTAKKKTN